MHNTPPPWAFCPAIEKMVSSGRILGEDGTELEYGGISTPSNLLELRRQIFRLKPRRTLEIGLAYGASALGILQTLLETHSDNNWSHTAIDPFQKWVWHGAGRRAALELAGEDHFTFIEDFSKFALPRLATEKCRFGLIYIDGSHLFEDVLLDLYYTMDLLEVGGVVLLDDCTLDHVEKVIRFCNRNLKNILTPEPIDISHKSWLRRTANRCGYAQLKAFRKIAEPPRSHDSKFYNF